MTRLLLLFALVGLSTSCKDKFEGPLVLGGQTVSADVLNEGHDIYRSLCARCHGTRGNGRTTGMRRDRKPRNLTDGNYKFTSVADNGLPTDADLARTVMRGLQGHLMPGFVTLPKTQVHAVVQYIKTFSPRWSDEVQGKGISIPKDPWAAPSDAVALGKAVYTDVAKCGTCHPGKMVDSIYGPLRSPDLNKDEMVGVFEARDVYRAVAVGLPGTGMPSYSGSLLPRQIWAVAHYVMSLKK